MKAFLKKVLGLDSRIYLGVAALSVAASLVTPLWTTRLSSPQYHGEEALRVTVYADGLKGNLQEIKTLNQYIGVKMPTDIPELKYTPWVLGGLLILVLFAVAFHGKARRILAVFLAVLMMVAALGAAVRLQQRLYQMGHDRGKNIIARMHDFTPPFIGEEKIANFEVVSLPGWGAYLYFLALALAGWSGLRRNSTEAVQKPSRLVSGKKAKPVHLFKAG
jgi:copper chaperone NosL